MQLRLIRFNLFILLSVGLIHVEAFEKLPRLAALTPNPVAMPSQQLSSSSSTDKDKNSKSPKPSGLVVQKNSENRGMQRHRGEKIFPSLSHSTTLLAEKFAQDALHSKEMQDTINDLITLNDNKKQQREMLKKTQKIYRPISTAHSARHSAKNTMKSKNSGKNKGLGNRKHNSHRKHGRKHRHRKRRLKRHPSEKEFSKTVRKRKSRKSVSRWKQRGLNGERGSGRSVICRRKRNDHITNLGRRLDHISREDPEPFMDHNQNIIDELPNLESTQREYRRIPIAGEGGKKNALIHRKRSHVLAQLMLTTTSDPTKKKPGDQGVEYSEYYSDNDDILIPEIRAQSAMGVAKTLTEGQGRSVREAVDEHFFDQHYYDSSNEQLLEEENERSKRNDKKLVRVMEEPSNSMEYVDNTYGPFELKGVVNNDKIPPYLTNYNYIPDKGAEMLMMPNRISSDAHAIPNQNLPIFEYPPRSDVNSMNKNVQSVAQEQPGFLGNVLSHFPQPRPIEGNFQYYTNQEMPSQYSTISLISPVAFSVSTSPEKAMGGLGDIGVNVPETPSPFGFNTTFSYDSFGENKQIFGGTSVVPVSSKPSLANFGVTSPIDVSSVSFDSLELFSKPRAFSPEISASEVKYFNANDGAENTRGPDQIERIASRETAAESTEVKKGKKTGSSPTKIEAQQTITLSAMNNVKKYGASKADKGEGYNLLPTPCTLKSTSPKLTNTTLMVNETKAVASEILNEIIDELEELRLENPRNEQREGLPCRLTGSWVTTRAGVRIDMKVTNHSVEVTLDHLTPPITTEGLLNVTWNVTGFAPFKRGGPFTLLATNNHTKTLAVFVGACKVCQGIDTIEGSWTVSREPRDCRDFQMSTNIFNEIFRRTRLYSAIKDKQLKHETQTPSTTVTAIANISTSEGTNILHEPSDNLGKFHNQSLEINGKE